MEKSRTPSLGAFWFWAFAGAWVLTVPIALANMKIIAVSPVPSVLQWAIGFVPAIVAIVLARRAGEWPALRSALWRNRGTVAGYGLTIVFSFGILAAVLLAHKAMGNPSPDLYTDPSVAIFAIVWLILAAGEEIGWRGYALPKLMQRYNLFTAALILGVIWCVWHYPKLYSSPFIKDFSSSLPWVASFSVQIIASNFIICWLFARFGRSVWLTSVYHMLWNTVATLYVTIAIDDIATAFIVGIAALLIVVDRKTFFERLPENKA